MTELKSYALSGTRELILNYMEKNPKGAVLDIPSGQGAFSKDLEERGFTVFLGDLDVNNVLYRNCRVAKVDLNHHLPFKNNSFDYLICIEGVEHIENPHHLVREGFRLLKDNGCLIVTTPNVMTIKSRLRFLFCSYLDYFRYFGPIKGESRFVFEEYDHQHINPVFYGEMKHILMKYGFSIETVAANKMVKRWKLMHPLIKSIIRHKTKKRFPRDPFYISDTLLDGEDLIFIARKNSTPMIPRSLLRGDNFPGKDHSNTVPSPFAKKGRNVTAPSLLAGEGQGPSVSLSPGGRWSGTFSFPLPWRERVRVRGYNPAVFIP